jgi:hypothetical protein
LADFKIPSLQHFVTFCGGTEDEIYRRIVRRENDIVRVSYETLRTKWAFDLIQLGVPFETVWKACEKIKSDLNRAANLSALAALKPYIELVKRFNCVRFEKSYYDIGRGMRVPVNPPFLLVNESEQKVLWISFWATRKLRGFTASLFATILEKAVFTLPDLRDFQLELVDLSKPGKLFPRALEIRGRGDFELLDDISLKAETDKFVMALLRRTDERAAGKPAAERKPSRSVDDLPLFLDRGIYPRT